MSLSEWYIRRPIATSLLMVGLLVLGSTAYTLLPALLLLIPVALIAVISLLRAEGVVQELLLPPQDVGHAVGSNPRPASCASHHASARPNASVIPAPPTPATTTQPGCGSAVTTGFVGCFA